MLLWSVTVSGVLARTANQHLDHKSAHKRVRLAGVFDPLVVLHRVSVYVGLGPVDAGGLDIKNCIYKPRQLFDRIEHVDHLDGGLVQVAL